MSIPRLQAVLFLVVCLAVAVWWNCPPRADYPGRWEAWWLQHWYLPLLTPFLLVIALFWTTVLWACLSRPYDTPLEESEPNRSPAWVNPWWLVLFLPVFVAGAAHCGRDTVKEAFLQNREHFEAVLCRARPAGESWSVDPPCRIGPYRIDGYAGTRDGDVYFRTASGPEGLFDRRSFGFAYRPSLTWTPFGTSRIELVHLEGDWYAFAVTDEW